MAMGKAAKHKQWENRINGQGSNGSIGRPGGLAAAVITQLLQGSLTIIMELPRWHGHDNEGWQGSMAVAMKESHGSDNEGMAWQRQ